MQLIDIRDFMEPKLRQELDALARFEQIADEHYSNGKKGRELMKELTRDKKMIRILGTLDYIPKLSDEDKERREKYYESLTEKEKEVISKYYKLFLKMEKYSNGEGGESTRDKKFAAFMREKFEEHA